MWLITNFGFFSVVEKPTDKGKNTLTIRARVKADLDQLRTKYIPSLGPTVADAGSDYKYRAVASRTELASAAQQMIADIDYSNFKSSVAKKQGSKREKIYHELWHSLYKLEDLQPPVEAKPEPPKPPKSKLPLSYGGVVLDLEGRVLLRKPKGAFDGYVWTFRRPEPGELPEQTAIHEVVEETGCLSAVWAEIEGVFRGGTSDNHYFLLKAISPPASFRSDETQEIRWVSFEEAEKLIAQTRNVVGRERDLAVLVSALKLATRKYDEDNDNLAALGTDDE